MDREAQRKSASPRWRVVGEGSSYEDSPHLQFFSAVRRSRLWRPPTDLFENEEEYVVVVEIAGMRGAEISVAYEPHTLSIHGRRFEAPGHRAYHQMEIAFGEFATEVRIPGPVDASRIEANYVDGFLRVVLPRPRPTTIDVS
jgi:HSP20 family protein